MQSTTHESSYTFAIPVHRNRQKSTKRLRGGQDQKSYFYTSVQYHPVREKSKPIKNHVLYKVRQSKDIQCISAMSVQKICDRGRSWYDHTKIYHAGSNIKSDQNLCSERATNAMQATAPIQGMFCVLPTGDYKSWLSMWRLVLKKSDFRTSPSCIAENTKKHCPNKNNAKLRFINALIASGQPDCSPVCQRTRYARRKNDTNNAPKIS